MTPVLDWDYWLKPPADFALRLKAGEIHVWAARLDAAPALPWMAWLAPEELDHARKFRLERDRTFALASRGVLRHLLGEYLQTGPATVEFERTSFGKPHLGRRFSEASLRFNVSHSHELGLFAFARSREIGVDVEKIRPDSATEEFAGHCLAPGEAARLRCLAAEERVQAFFECWTRKEAYLKACGQGLMRELNTFEVAFGKETVPAILRVKDEPTAAEDWSVMNLRVGDSYAGALVMEARDEAPKVSCFRWSWL